MRKFAVVAYPALTEDDRQRIEAVRARYDPLAFRIAAHVTLVFPVEVAEEPLLAQVRTALQFCQPIPLVLRRAAAFRDAIGGGCYVCLLPKEGYAELRAVHDAVYHGVLAAHRRPDIPFVPHVTVGAHPELSKCERIATEFNEEGRIVHAAVESVDVIEVGESMVRTVAGFALGSGINEPPNPTVQRTEGSHCSPPGR